SSFFRFVGTADGLGHLDVTGIPEGSFTVQGVEPSTSRLGQTSGTIAPGQDGQIVPVTVTVVEAGFGVVRFSGERDLWVINGTAGDFLTLALDGAATQGFPGMGDPFVEIYNP